VLPKILEQFRHQNPVPQRMSLHCSCKIDFSAPYKLSRAISLSSPALWKRSLERLRLAGKMPVNNPGSESSTNNMFP
jgi:hypothetical protein